MAYFGLLGYPLGHSFSKPWFEARGARYDNFAYESVADFMKAIPADLDGFNVTIPHKRSVIEFLDEVDAAAAEVGAVNCVKMLSNKQLKGYNTDIIGFEDSLREFLGEGFAGRAAVLGSGGASRAVCYVLNKLNIDYQVVSRADGGYEKFDIGGVRLVVNTTPLGMYPNVNTAPPIEYAALDGSYFLYDLVYNPAQTEFLRRGRQRGAAVINGLAMLYAQAQAALRIFSTH